MAWTYTGAPATVALDAVRFLIQDTDTNRQLATDAECNYALTENGSNAYLAAAMVAETLSIRTGAVTNRSLGGGLMVSYSSGQWLTLAKRLRARAVRRTLKPYAGGISLDDKDSYEDEEDRAEPFFNRQTGESGGTPDPVRPNWSDA